MWNKGLCIILSFHLSCYENQNSILNSNLFKKCVQTVEGYDNGAKISLPENGFKYAQCWIKNELIFMSAEILN